MPDETLGTVIFLMTDIEGSTRLWETIPERMPHLLQRHDSIVASVVVGRRGSLVKARGEGDSHFAVFARGGDAVAAGVAIQRRLAEEEDLAAVPIRVRIGIHAGDATFREMDYYGPSVNRCARIRGVGYGGQILLSEAAMSLARDAVEPEIAFRDLGYHRLRDLLRPECLFQVVAEGLPDDFPTLLSLNGSEIPLQPTSFVGRRREVKEIGARLRTTRLLTLLGTGGVGKTRLAYQAAAEAIGVYDDGIVVVELADLTDPGAVPEALAAVLGRSDGDPFGALGGRSLLVVLDNCEHLFDGVRPLVRRVLLECPTVTVLTTSREPLRLAGETSYDVQPLTLPLAEPDSPEALLASEAGRLFVERAEAVAPRFALNAGNLAAIARVCVRLDGLPLAIELAAARANVLSPAQIDERLAHRFNLLGGARNTEEGRHRTMREAIDWSYRMLDAAERSLLGRVTAFRGGWTYEAVEKALEGRWPSYDDPLDVLQAVVERSLVTVEDLSGDAVRYRLLETIRDFVLEILDPAEDEAAKAGLFAWADAFAALAKDHFEGADQSRWFVRADAERENLRLAVVYGTGKAELRERALEIVVDLSRFLVSRGEYAFGRSLLEPALTPGDAISAPLRTKATNLVGVLAMGQGDLDVAAGRLAESLELARALGDSAAQAGSLANLGIIAWEREAYVEAREAFEEAVAMFQKVGDRGREGAARVNLGCVLMDMERLDEACESLLASLPPLEERGDLSRVALAIGNLGYLAILQERWGDARRYAQESLRAFGEVGDLKGTINKLVDAGTILVHDGDLEAAATLRGAVERMAYDAKALPTPHDAQWLATLDRALAEGLDEASVLRLRRRGAKMLSQNLIRYAIDRLESYAL